MNVAPMQVTLIDSMGSDLSVVNAARVSFNKESEWEVYESAPMEAKGLSKKDRKLIDYLAKHSHWTPFGHAFLSFRIKAPLFVARQLGKHQVGLCWNEVSRRYIASEPEFYFPDTWRKAAENVKQGSSEESVSLGWDSDVPKMIQASCLDLYNKLLDKGVCAEQARMVLPQSMHTEWIWSGSLAAFARVCKLRLDPHSQAETRDIAQLISDQVPDQFAHSWTALMGSE